jgi:hypothetical protein
MLFLKVNWQVLKAMCFIPQVLERTSSGVHWNRSAKKQAGSGWIFVIEYGHLVLATLEAAFLLIVAKIRHRYRALPCNATWGIINVVSRLKHRLSRNASAQFTDTSNSDVDFTGYVETGFQLATFQGPLCAEPVEGMVYFVESINVDADGIQKEIGTFFICV